MDTIVSSVEGVQLRDALAEVLTNTATRRHYQEYTGLTASEVSKQWSRSDDCYSQSRTTLQKCGIIAEMINSIGPDVALPAIAGIYNKKVYDNEKAVSDRINEIMRQRAENKEQDRLMLLELKDLEQLKRRYQDEEKSADRCTVPADI